MGNEAATEESVLVVSRSFEASREAAISLSLLKFVGQASLVDDAMLPS